MARYLIERTFGSVSEAEMGQKGSASKKAANEKYTDIVWEHSHAVGSDQGVKTFCVYEAPSEQYVRDHAEEAGLPVDRIFEIQADVGPGDFE